MVAGSRVLLQTKWEYKLYSGKRYGRYKQEIWKGHTSEKSVALAPPFESNYVVDHIVYGKPSLGRKADLTVEKCTILKGYNDYDSYGRRDLRIDIPTYPKSLYFHMLVLFCLHPRKFATWAKFLQWLKDERYDVDHGKFGFMKLKKGKFVKIIDHKSIRPLYLRLNRGQGKSVQRLYDQLEVKRQKQKKRQVK